jgi:hypothetical protein
MNCAVWKVCVAQPAFQRQARSTCRLAGCHGSPSRARVRPAGLIAGSESPPPQPDGLVRITDVTFEPCPDEVPVFVRAPDSMRSWFRSIRVAA